MTSDRTVTSPTACIEINLDILTSGSQLDRVKWTESNRTFTHQNSRTALEMQAASNTLFRALWVRREQTVPPW